MMAVRPLNQFLLLLATLASFIGVYLHIHAAFESSHGPFLSPAQGSYHFHNQRVVGQPFDYLPTSADGVKANIPGRFPPSYGISELQYNSSQTRNLRRIAIPFGRRDSFVSEVSDALDPTIWPTAVCKGARLQTLMRMTIDQATAMLGQPSESQFQQFQDLAQNGWFRQTPLGANMLFPSMNQALAALGISTGDNNLAVKWDHWASLNLISSL
jgi:hypothetical protein